MNTHGHKSIAEDVGEKIIQDVIGKDNRSINSFYFGNWLTDMSQFVDPVATNSVKNKADSLSKLLFDKIDEVFSEVLNHIPFFPIPKLIATVQREAVKKKFKKELGKAKKNISILLTELLESETKNSRESHLAQFTRDVLLVVAYFKFSHPLKPGQKHRIEEDVFYEIFGKITSPSEDHSGRFTQYYPHEHLDRPPCLRCNEKFNVYAPGIITNKNLSKIKQDQIKQHKIKQHKNDNPGRYNYLETELTIAYALITEVDLDIRKKLIEKKYDEDDLEWNMLLAKLGHAIHIMEDFYAHSNWIELVMSTYPQNSEEFKEILPGKKGIKFIDRAWTIYSKRLKSHLTLDLNDWTGHKNEDWLVTGYFDFQDTFISISHWMEEVFGWVSEDPSLHINNTIHNIKYQKKDISLVEEVQTILVETLDFITDTENSGDSIKKRFEETLNETGGDFSKLQTPYVSKEIAKKQLKNYELFKSIPESVNVAFMNAIVVGSKIHAGRSLYAVLKTISQTIKNPHGWIKNYMISNLPKKIATAIAFYLKDILYRKAGSERVGCHSLLAKDHGNEPLFIYQKECAKAAHHFIIKNIFRPVLENEKGPKPIEEQVYIDWDKAIRHFVPNPLYPNQKKGNTGQIKKEKKTIRVITKVKEDVKIKKSKNTLSELLRLNLGIDIRSDAGKEALKEARSLYLKSNIIFYNPEGTALNMLIETILKDNNIIKTIKNEDNPNLYVLNKNSYAYKEIPMGFSVTTNKDNWYNKVIKDRDYSSIFNNTHDTGVILFKGYTPTFLKYFHVEDIIKQGQYGRRMARESYDPNLKANIYCDNC